jgi:GNAT superfamily N-acetyltransferase
MAIEIRVMTKNDADAVLTIAEALSEWFDEDARLRALPLDLRFQDGFVAAEADDIMGFITLYVAEGRVNIGWMGVHPGVHRQGVGAALLQAAEGYCRERGINELATYTLGSGVDYAPYDHTRAFYFAKGFSIYQRSQTDNPSIPEEIKIKKEVE